MAALVRSMIVDDRMYHGNGVVKDWSRKITLKFSAEAKRYAPKRTGRMAKSIRASLWNPGPKMCEGRIGVSAPYTMYVLRGTGFPVRGSAGKIYTTRGFIRYRFHSMGAEKTRFDTHRRDRFTKVGQALPGTLLSVGKQSARHTPLLRLRWVAGQEPNDFLERAWRSTARNHTSIRGIPFPLSYD